MLFDFLERMTFRTLTARVRAALGEGESNGLRKDDTAPEASAPGELDTPENIKFDREKYVCVQDVATLKDWVTRAMQKEVVAVDLETDSLDSAAAKLVGVCLAVDDNEACYIPLGHTGGGGDMFGAEAPKPHILKVGQNFKYDLGVFQRYGLNPAPYDDTMLISYALEAGLRGHGMDAMSELYFGHKAIPFKEIAGTGKSQKTFDQIELDVATPYAAEDADVTLRLWKFLKPKLALENVATAYETLDRNLPAVVAKMENEGIKVDRSELNRLSGLFAQKMAQLEDEAYELAGTKFNIGSPKQIGEILFDTMGLDAGFAN